jgi:hypothetical protein
MRKKEEKEVIFIGKDGDWGDLERKITKGIEMEDKMPKLSLEEQKKEDKEIFVL